MPVEAKAGETLAGDVFRGLDYYLGLAGGGAGVLVYGGAESYVRRIPRAELVAVRMRGWIPGKRQCLLAFACGGI